MTFKRSELVHIPQAVTLYSRWSTKPQQNLNFSPMNFTYWRTEKPYVGVITNPNAECTGMENPMEIYIDKAVWVVDQKDVYHLERTREKELND